MSNNTNLHKSKNRKNDEFYTFIEDVEKEVVKYKKDFQGKRVFLPCDGEESSFWKFFISNFDDFGLKSLCAIKYNESGKGKKIFTQDGIIVKESFLEGNGDFRSKESLEILADSDIICTNPPFSLFRELISILNENGKSFLLIGNQNAFAYKEIFRLFMSNKIRIGYNMVKEFYLPDGTKKKFGNICWFTNLETENLQKEIPLKKTYSPDLYPKYDNYEAIEVNRVANIPKDYFGVMGVPITFLYKYNPSQFEILGNSRYHDGSDTANDIGFINGKEVYTRVLIRRKI